MTNLEMCMNMTLIYIEKQSGFPWIFIVDTFDIHILPWPVNKEKTSFRNFSAPTETTLHDFIRMIWQLRIQSIIMVTRLFEDGKVV